MSHLAPAFAIVAATLSGPVLAVAAAPPPTGAILLVISPPWKQVEEIVARTQARIIGPVDAPIGSLVIADGGTTQELVSALAEAGAWAVMNGSWLASICGVAA